MDKRGAAAAQSGAGKVFSDGVSRVSAECEKQEDKEALKCVEHVGHEPGRNREKK